ncbi:MULTISPECIES: adenylyl-sulfate kinase [unclassified Oleiphilus]|uniref:adenylyl-sulfate kinase n=1 Tax=unclassified Oleiphilus TaxID=2631174 RepID=UPI0007C3E6F8|nr:MULTISPECIES: adenylyl-sulfate kinase [unclassified Oleiphilus]KZZ37808.1 adenylyl-sulfate kinase [Oleiphilus sp. HI0117]KZZ55348.1 adenylyl-sulfate kinase [Oleiphilus sp. HI0123]
MAENNIVWHEQNVSRAERSVLKKQKPCLIWFTGLSGAGKSTIANALDRWLHDNGYHTYLLDGDNVRHGLNKDLGFSDEDRVENIRRVGEVSGLFVDAGVITLSAFISPFRSERRMVRDMFAEGEFIEVFVNTPFSICEERDPKGLYKQARAGKIKNFTGIDSAYEKPEKPEINIDTSKYSVAIIVDTITSELKRRGILF